jgi:hypothetical protein
MASASVRRPGRRSADLDRLWTQTSAWSAALLEVTLIHASPCLIANWIISARVARRHLVRMRSR